jgi:hypothetical protein
VTAARAAGRRVTRAGRRATSLATAVRADGAPAAAPVLTVQTARRAADAIADAMADAVPATALPPADASASATADAMVDVTTDAVRHAHHSIGSALFPVTCESAAHRVRACVFVCVCGCIPWRSDRRFPFAPPPRLALALARTFGLSRKGQTRSRRTNSAQLVSS